jgi:hypothetical protein
MTTATWAALVLALVTLGWLLVVAWRELHGQVGRRTIIASGVLSVIALAAMGVVVLAQVLG